MNFYPKIQGEDKRNIMFKLFNRDVKQNILKKCNVVKTKEVPHHRKPNTTKKYNLIYNGTG